MLAEIHQVTVELSTAAVRAVCANMARRDGGSPSIEA
jgi:hypothetical protein